MNDAGVAASSSSAPCCNVQQKVFETRIDAVKNLTIAAASLWAAAAMPALAAPNAAAGATVPAAPAETAAAVAAGFSGDLFIHGALTAMQALDKGDAARIYDGASATMKRVISREEFIASAMATATGTSGGVMPRDWSRIERHRIDAPASSQPATAVPPGLYVTVYLLALAPGGETRVEQVSFRLDEDNQWRLAGARTAEAG